MASAVSGKDPICSYICKTLGLDPKSTRSLAIKMEAGNIVVVTAEIYPDKRQMEIIGVLLEEYELVSKEEIFGGRNEEDCGKEITKDGSEGLSEWIDQVTGPGDGNALDRDS